MIFLARPPGSRRSDRPIIGFDELSALSSREPWNIATRQRFFPGPPV